MRPFPSFARRSLLIASTMLMATGACDRAPKAPPAATAPVTAPAVEPTPQPQPSVDRAELLRALDAAASAVASGEFDSGAGLNGRRFAVRMAFGCTGPAPRSTSRPEGLANWVWGPGDKTIELTLKPADWTSQFAPGPEAAESIEGFWIDRPWIRSDSCPPPPTQAAPAPFDSAPISDPSDPKAGPPSWQTAGLASVFAQGASRVGRRDGKPFAHTIRSENGPLPYPAGGYRLLIEGRFTAFPGGATFACRTHGPDRRPTCLVASTVDRVVFETSGGEPLSEWRPG